MKSKLKKKRVKRIVLKPKRKGPTSVRFNADDLALLAKLKARWQTDGPTSTLRKAMTVAEAEF